MRKKGRGCKVEIRIINIKCNKTEGENREKIVHPAWVGLVRGGVADLAGSGCPFVSVSQKCFPTESQNRGGVCGQDLPPVWAVRFH